MPGLSFVIVTNMNDEITLRRMNGDDEAWKCADIMSTTEPWITLGTTRLTAYRNASNPQGETYVAAARDEIVGVVIVAMTVPLIKGYINALAVKDGWRNRGIGGRLLAFAEERIGRDSPNCFLCVSSFNADAQRFYRRMGYEQVGEFADYIIAGASELLMRKSKGPWTEFQKYEI